MVRLSLVVLVLLAFAGCGGPHGDLNPSELHGLALEALERGDSQAALGHYRAAAGLGDLQAMGIVASAYSAGYLAGPRTDRGEARHMAIRTWPGQAARWQRRYDDELALRVDRGDRDALFIRATHLTQARVEDGSTIHPSDASRAEAHRILLYLAERGDSRAMVSLGVQALDSDRESAAEWFANAAASGDAQGCWFTMMFIDHSFFATNVSETAHTIDRAEECRRLDPEMGHDYAVEILTHLRRLRDPEMAEATLDSLRVLGVFERHPRLAVN